MIYVGGVPFFADASHGDQGIETLTALLEHPLLVAASNSLNSMAERKISISSSSSKLIYIFQREFATVDPSHVDLVGTDEATTCVGIAIRNSRTGMTSMAHMDFPNVVETGLSQILSLVADQDADALLDVHILGSFVDISSQKLLQKKAKLEGYSYPLCAKIVEALQNRQEKFHLQTLHVLRHNTRWDSYGNGYPIFHGFVMESSTGSIFPASFDETSRCPDDIVRRIRLSASFTDPSSCNRLLDTYDTRNDVFVIAPCTWTMRQVHIALMLQKQSDEEILLTCSSSPSAEGPEFVHNERRKMDYLIHHPLWHETFPLGQPRVFRRGGDGSWIKQ